MRRNLPFTRRQANMLSITRRFKRPVRFARNHNFAFRRFVSGLPDLSSSTCVSFFNQTWPTGTATTDADLEFMKEEERLQRSFIDQSWPLVPLRWQKPFVSTMPLTIALRQRSTQSVRMHSHQQAISTIRAFTRTRTSPARSLSRYTISVKPNPQRNSEFQFRSFSQSHRQSTPSKHHKPSSTNPSEEHVPKLRGYGLAPAIIVAFLISDLFLSELLEWCKTRTKNRQRELELESKLKDKDMRMFCRAMGDGYYRGRSWKDYERKVASKA